MQAIAEHLFRQATGMTTKSVTRFPVGLCHYVYHVTTAEDEEFVLRLATPGNRTIIKGWQLLVAAVGEARPPHPANSA